LKGGPAARAPLNTPLIVPFFGNAPLVATEGRRNRYNRSTGIDTAVFGPSQLLKMH